MAPLRMKLEHKKKPSHVHLYALAPLANQEQRRAASSAQTYTGKARCWVGNKGICLKHRGNHMTSRPPAHGCQLLTALSCLPCCLMGLLTAWARPGSLTLVSKVYSCLHRDLAAYTHNWTVLLLGFLLSFRTTSLIMTYISMDLINIRWSETKTLSFPDVNTIQTVTWVFMINDSLLNTGLMKYPRVSLVILDPVSKG